MFEMITDNDELMEKRIELRQKLKSKLLTLSSSQHILNSFNNFIPNSRDFDFLEHQGLDCVMNYLIDTHSIDFISKRPHICSNCRTDSTVNWWSSSFQHQQTICDQCEQNQMRYFMLEQHRQSMKSAFLQAKESERRLEVNYQQQNKKL